MIKVSRNYLGQEKTKLLRFIVYIYHLDGCAYKLEYDCVSHKCSVVFWKFWIRSKVLEKPGKVESEGKEDSENWTLV